MRKVGWSGRVILNSHYFKKNNHVFVLEFAWQQKKDGLSPRTIKTRNNALKKLDSLGANLNNPESVKTVLATNELSKAYTLLIIRTYNAFCKFHQLQWKPPKCNKPQKEPFLPTNEEVQQLISACGKNTATLLKFLDETGTRIGEAVETKWIDIDFKAKTVKINNPEKCGNTRTLKISDNLIAMLNALKKRTDNHIFNPREKTVYATFYRTRKRTAEKLQNPRINQIHFHTLRHLKATNEYQKTKDINHVKYILGHKSVMSTERYTHYITFNNEEYITKVAKTPEECCKLAEAGFTKFDEFPNEGIRLYKKRK